MEPGKTVIYFTGDLAITRAMMAGGGFTGQELREIARQVRVANVLFTLAEADMGHLTQRKLSAHKYEYRFMLNERPVSKVWELRLLAQMRNEMEQRYERK